MFFKSFPAMSGAARMHQRLKWERYSVVVMAPLPTSSNIWIIPVPRAGVGFQADLQIQNLREAKWPFLHSQQSAMSPVVRQRLPSLCPKQAYGAHSQRLRQWGGRRL